MLTCELDAVSEVKAKCGQANTPLECPRALWRILRATPSAAGPDVGLDGLRMVLGWFGDGFWATWGAFWRDLRPLGRDWRALEASWKGLESPGGLWRGLGTPRSQVFEDVSSRLLDSGGPGTGRAMVVMVILCGLGPLRNQYLGLRT